jgi:S1-C subfamily serine protease
MILAAVGAGALALVALAVVLFLVLRPGEQPSPEVAAAQAKDTGSTQAGSKETGKEQKAGTNPEPKQTQPEPKLPPPEPLPAEIGQAIVQKVKHSTAYLHVTLHNGGEAEGSGFFVGEPGILMTNAHVLGMLQADGRRPSAVEVVVNKGEPDEVRFAGKVLGVDRGTDLAVLRVEGDAAKLPAPLPVGTAAAVFETQKIYIFGFPLGAELGKSITVNPSWISSLRRGDDGVLNQLQVRGGMNPGNSGGPVTDTRGTLVGVSVAGIRGTEINFAIPADFVTAVLHGRVEESVIGEPYLDKGQPKLPVRLSCLDPLKRIKEIKVEVWAGNPGKPRSGGSAAPRPVDGDGTHQGYAVRYEGGEATADVPVPPLTAGKVYWLQPVLTGAGPAHWGQAVSFQPSSPAALERRAAMLQLKYPQQGQKVERTLKLKVNAQLTSATGKSSRTLAEKLEADLLEEVSGHPLGAGLRLPFGDCQFAAEVNGRPVPRSPKATAWVKQLPPRFVANLAGALKERADPNFRALGPGLADDVQDMYQQVCNGFEATCLQAPGRELDPLQTWTTRQPMLISAGVEKEIADMNLTCTLQGVRSHGGRSEAYFTLAGEVKGRGKRLEATGGKVSGHGLFDLDQGFLSHVKLKISSEVDLTADLRLALTTDIDLTRTAGNVLGIKGPAPRPGPGPVARGKVLINANGALTLADAMDRQRPGRRARLHLLPLTAGKRYVIEMNQAPGSKLDPYLRLEDARGAVLAEDDDGGGFPNARIVFTAPRTEVYRLVLTTFNPNETGAFVLTVSEAAGP